MADQGQEHYLDPRSIISYTYGDPDHDPHHFDHGTHWYGQHDQDDFHWTWDSIVLTPILGIIVVGTIIGNFSVLYHFLGRLRKRGPDSLTPTHFFIANLSLADFLVGVFVLPFLATLQITGRWYFGQCFCTIWVCTHFTLCAASIMSTCAVCIERYIGVRYPIQHMRILSLPRIILFLITVWILAATPSVIRVFAWTEPKIEIPYKCIINQKIGHAILAGVGIFYIPAFTMVILYFKIYLIASRHMKTQRAGMAKARLGINYQQISLTTSDKSEGEKQPQLQSMEKRQINLARKLSILVGVVLFSYGPYFTLILLKGVNPSMVNPHVFDTFAWIRYFNSFLNPFIYAYAVPAFNQAFRKSFVGRSFVSKSASSTANTHSSKNNNP